VAQYSRRVEQRDHAWRIWGILKHIAIVLVRSPFNSETMESIASYLFVQRAFSASLHGTSTPSIVR